MALLAVSDLSAHYQGPRGTVRAVDGVSFGVEPGETVGLVGESGCGKSTLGKAVLRLVPSVGGSIQFDGQNIGGLGHRALKRYRRRMQMVFQDPFASLNPRQTVGDILTAPLAVHGVGNAKERRRQAADMLGRVGLPRESLERFPHEFSGGQRQRIGIAQALVLRPELVVCDEPVSALDLSVQAQILNLLTSMKQEFGLSYLFISHDLSVMRYFADQILVMYLGRIVESAPSQTLWDRPRHPYTQALMGAVPGAAGRHRRPKLAGDIPNAADLPSGCRFHPRCPKATALCVEQEPVLRRLDGTESVACHHPD